MPATSALADCRRFTDAVSAAGGRMPDVLSHILEGAALLVGHSGASDPAKRIVSAAVAGELTDKSLTPLITEAATAQMINSYRGELRHASVWMSATEIGCPVA